MQHGEEADPRWSLANERTFLAYLRTSLAFVVAGLAVAGSYSATDAPAWLAMMGLPLILIGIVLGGTAHRRYAAADRAMRRGHPLPPPLVTRHVPWVLTIVGVIGFTLAFAQLLTER